MKEFLCHYNAFREDLDRQKPSDPNISIDSLKYESHFKDSMTWLMTEAKNHTSVDTFAKMLHLTNDDKGLARLKATLATYLVIAQAMYGTDLRYDGFLATILQHERFRSPLIPDHIRIATWNYDLQLEKAFYRYSQNTQGVFQAITSNPHVIRVNGLAGLEWPGTFSKYTETALRPFSIETVLISLEMYSVFVTDIGRPFFNIQFAWEQDPVIFQRNIAPAIEDTTILIDIGYSFPFFNRDVDRILLNCMIKLKKIYIQVLRPEHDAIKSRLQSIISVLPEVQYIYDEKRFFIPYEL